MKSSTRTALAFIAARLISKQQSDAIYDVAERRFFRYSGTVSEAGIDLFDQIRACNIPGSISGSDVRFYDEREEVHIDFKIERNSFHGFDPATEMIFHGGIDGESIWIDLPKEGRFLYHMSKVQAGKTANG